MNRKEALNALIELQLPVSKAIQHISTFEWDSEKCLVVLSPAHVEKALRLFTEGTLSDVDVEAWANTLECRDDLAFSEPALSKVLFRIG